MIDLIKEIDNLDLIPVNGKILVKEKEVKQIGSIIIPETSKQLRATEGTILAMAVDLEEDDEINLSVGDEVFYGRYSGILVVREGGEYYLMNADDVLAIVIKK